MYLKVMRVTARDPDEGINGTVMYDLIMSDGSQDLHFYMQTRGTSTCIYSLLLPFLLFKKSLGILPYQRT